MPILTQSSLFNLLYGAVVANDDPKLALLLSKHRAKSRKVINKLSENGNTPLHQASSKGQLEVAKLLVEAGANVDATDKYGKTPLYWALSEGNVPLYKLLKAAGATVDGATATISPLVPSDVIRAIVPEDTPFWLAANNDAPMLAVELVSGLDPNMKTENGMTLLHWACAGDAPECVQLLLDAGADKEAGDLRPIFYCMHESSDCLKCTINYDADSHTLFSCWMPLHYALAANSPACVEVLVRPWILITEDNSILRYQNPSPLQIALETRPVPVDALRALLAAAGERVLNRTIHSKPPLYYAVENSTVDGVRLLVEAGAYIEEKYSQFANLLEFARFSASKQQSSTNTECDTDIITYLENHPHFRRP